MREKEKYAVKEREEVVKKAREQRVAEIKVGHYLGKFVVGRGEWCVGQPYFFSTASPPFPFRL